VSIILGVLGLLGFIAHFVLYHRTSVSAFIDRPEFYYNRFLIRDGSGQTIREVSLSTGFWTYATAATGVVFFALATGILILSKRCKR
jgi:hypothetical protein